MQVDQQQFLENGFLILRQIVEPVQLDSLRLSVEIFVDRQKAQSQAERGSGCLGGTWCAEALQVVAGQWRIRDSFDTFAAVDAGKTDGLDTRGYYGAVFDGRYVYYCPGYRPGRPNGSSRLWGDIGRLRVAVRAMSAAEIAEDQERCPQTI